MKSKMERNTKEDMRRSMERNTKEDMRRSMGRKGSSSFLIAGCLLLLFFIWTVFIQVVDVQTIGPNESAVGFATWNGFFHRLTGVHMLIYTVTDWLGLVPLFVIAGFAVLGLVQLITRKSICKVDQSILVLGGFYFIVFAFYILFEMVVVNYRPVLIDGYLEASYPSSTTLLVMCVMPAAIMQLHERMRKGNLRKALEIIIAIFTVCMVTGRLISGVHWFTDIIGGALLSGGLVMLYYAVCHSKINLQARRSAQMGVKMDIEVRKLRPEDAEAYVTFFDTTPHDDRIPDHTCYCVNFCSADHHTLNRPGREERRAMALEYVQKGILQGYVALHNHRIIGWCNANTKSDCANCAGVIFALPDLQQAVSAPQDKVKAIYCFMIAEEYHRQGIARRLLQAVCEDAKAEGFDYVEAYPQKDASIELMQFMGFDTLYASEGFEHAQELEDKYVVRKYL